MKDIRIGVIGTGRITDRFFEESTFADNAKVVSVFNPRLSSAKEYAKAHNLLLATNNFAEFIGEVDAVYIASPHEYHIRYILDCLNAGKHVLCEKPLVLMEKDARKAFELAKSKNLVLMEAVKTAYTPGFKKILEIIDSGLIGKVYDVEACFTKLTPSDTREVWSEHGGSFTELGSYCLLPVVKILGTSNLDVKVNLIEAASGVDSYCKATFGYADAMATVKTGIGVKSEGELIIAGSEGYIQVRSPWWSPRHIEVRHENPAQTEVFDCELEGTALRYEIKEFIDRINGETEISLTETECIWMARQIEKISGCRKQPSVIKPKVWAHRGCSKAYPENTLAAFKAAAELSGITGIELDIQLSLDGEIVVIHDETLNRTMGVDGNVKDFPYKKLHDMGIPSIHEVFKLLKPYCENNNLLINIELKNSKIRYEGMEKKILALTKEYGLEKYVIYSSFLPESMGLIKELDASARTAVLSVDIHQGLANMSKYKADAVHPGINGLDININFREKLNGIAVRAWNNKEPFYGQDKPDKETDLNRYACLGVTDFFTNVPEKYLK